MSTDVKVLMTYQIPTPDFVTTLERKRPVTPTGKWRIVWTDNTYRLELECIVPRWNALTGHSEEVRVSDNYVAWIPEARLTLIVTTTNECTEDLNNNEEHY